MHNDYLGDWGPGVQISLLRPVKSDSYFCSPAPRCTNSEGGCAIGGTRRVGSSGDAGNHPIHHRIFHGGRVHLPEAPGFGLEVDWKAVKALWS
jgi:hypothetical protein